MSQKLEDVFGISTKPILSYVERISVDDKFKTAVNEDKHIIVYGASKQGKTALASKYLPYKENILVSLSPQSSIQDIYSTILREAGIRIKESQTSGSSTSGTLKAGLKITALIPFLGSGETKTEGSATAGREASTTYREIPFNLELPQDISELLKEIGNKKWVILENFHYLSDEIQKRLAFDLRSFQELNLKFVILGVWREKNRLIQFNGDLLERVAEIPVEPWTEADFKDVVVKGSQLLNVALNPDILLQCIEYSYGSIGVFQEFMKGLCAAANVYTTSSTLTVISSKAFVTDIVKEKLDHYASRHQRALESIAESIRPKLNADETPLFLPFYLVKVVLTESYDNLKSGMHRNTLKEEIKKRHHRPDGVRSSDIANLLHTLGEYQFKKSINPPIFDYDRSLKRLQIVDSTFFFFLKFANKEEVLAEIPSPLDLLGNE